MNVDQGTAVDLVRELDRGHERNRMAVRMRLYGRIIAIVVIARALSSCAMHVDETASPQAAGIVRKCFALVQASHLHATECRKMAPEASVPAMVCYTLGGVSDEANDLVMSPGQQLTIVKVFRHSRDTFNEGVFWSAYAQLIGGRYDGAAVQLEDGVTQSGAVRLAPDLFVPCSGESTDPRRS